MKHFERIAENIDIAPLLEEIDRQPDAWEQQVGRQESAPAQRETSSIPIRGLRASRIHGRRRRDVHESRFTGLSKRFPAIVAYIERVAAEQDAELARAKLARLAPGYVVFPHVDRGDYYRWHDRYHLVLRSPTGSILRAGEEEVRMREGELWWFDNKAVHEAGNTGPEPRIHLIFDLKPQALENLRSPRPVLTGLEDEEPSPGHLLLEARDRIRRREAEAVQETVRLYLAGRAQPRRWRRLLERHGFDPDADDFRPLRAAVRLIARDIDEQAVVRRGRAVVWALERIDKGALAWDDIAEAIVREGGVSAVARAWKKEQEFD